MKDVLRIQDRFAAEPVLSRTGNGYLTFAGTATDIERKQLDSMLAALGK